MKYLKTYEGKSKYIDYTKLANAGDKVICVNDGDKIGTHWKLIIGDEYSVIDVLDDMTIYYKLEEDPDKTWWRASRFTVNKIEAMKKFDL